MLFAMTDLMEQGAPEAVLRRCSRRSSGGRRNSTSRCTTCTRCSCTPAGPWSSATTTPPSASPTKRWPPVSGRTDANAEVAYAGQLFQLGLGPWPARRTGAAGGGLRRRRTGLPVWQVALAGSTWRRACSTRRAPIFERFVDRRPRLLFPTTRCSSRRQASWSRRRAGWTIRSGRGCCSTSLEPYGDRIAVTGLGGVCIGPVSRYVGVAAHACGQTEEAVRWLTQAVDDSEQFGSPPFEARATPRPRRRPARPWRRGRRPASRRRVRGGRGNRRASRHGPPRGAVGRCHEARLSLPGDWRLSSDATVAAEGAVGEHGRSGKQLACEPSTSHSRYGAGR